MLPSATAQWLVFGVSNQVCMDVSTVNSGGQCLRGQLVPQFVNTAVRLQTT
jgi:hypothetical protein